jgi:hypothetical protein
VQAACAAHLLGPNLQEQGVDAGRPRDILKMRRLATVHAGRVDKNLGALDDGFRYESTTLAFGALAITTDFLGGALDFLGRRDY